MHAPFAFDTDPFAAPFAEALAPGRAGVDDTVDAGDAVTEGPLSDVHAVPDGVTALAESLRGAGFVEAAMAMARLAGDDRVTEWSATAQADAALASLIAVHGEAVIPSLPLRADGAPRFVVCGPDTAALRAHFADEHGERGVDAELRLFLDEALQPGDRFVDASPGAGFAALTAATRDAVTVLALVDDGAAGDALVRSARVSACDAAVTVRALADAQALDIGAHDGLTVLHAGPAGHVAPLLQAMRAGRGTLPVDAVAWRCGAAHDADHDAEAMQVAAAVLGVLGFRHFALAHGAQGVELVPAEAMASNTMIFSLAEPFLARAGA